MALMTRGVMLGGTGSGAEPAMLVPQSSQFRLLLLFLKHFPQESPYFDTITLHPPVLTKGEHCLVETMPQTLDTMLQIVEMILLVSDLFSSRQFKINEYAQVNLLN